MVLVRNQLRRRMVNCSLVSLGRIRAQRGLGRDRVTSWSPEAGKEQGEEQWVLLIQLGLSL